MGRDDEEQEILEIEARGDDVEEQQMLEAEMEDSERTEVVYEAQSQKNTTPAKPPGVWKGQLRT